MLATTASTSDSCAREHAKQKGQLEDQFVIDLVTDIGTSARWDYIEHRREYDQVMAVLTDAGVNDANKRRVMINDDAYVLLRTFVKNTVEKLTIEYVVGFFDAADIVLPKQHAVWLQVAKYAMEAIDQK